MIAMSDRHPDIQEFITVKSDLSKISGANLSVQFSKELQDAAINDKDWTLCFPIDDKDLINLNIDEFPYNKLINIEKGKYIKKIKAKELFDLIIDMAWKNAEPGILLKSNIIDYDPASVYENLRYVVSNPCGEQPLAPWDSCRLGSVNLYSFVRNKFTKDAYFDFDNFYKTVYKSVLFMDNIIDCEISYLQNIINTSNDEFEKDLWNKAINIAKQGRRIGLGFTALGDCIAAMNMNFYDSKEFIESIMHIKMESELNATIDLGILKGSFESFDLNKEYNDSNAIIRGKNKFYRFIEKKYPSIISKMIVSNARRNVSFSTVAPNGSLSLLASKIGTTSGIEPLFKALYIRRRKVSINDPYDFKDPNTGEVFKEFYIAHGGLKEYCKIVFEKEFDDLIKKDQIEVFKSSPYYKNQAEDLSWQCRLDIQEIIQRYTSSAISTTINLPESVSKDVIKNIYINAYDKGLKGCTVFRDGSRSGILVNTNKKQESKMIEHNAPKRPQVLPCDIHSLRQKSGDYICAVGLMDDIPYEIFVFEGEKLDNKKGFIKKIKSGYYSLLNENREILVDNLSSVMIPGIEDLTRGYSYGLRHSGQIKFAVEQLQKSKGNLSDFSKVLSRTLKKYIKDGEASSEKCHKCGEKLVFEAGCKICPSCGESYCS